MPQLISESATHIDRLQRSEFVSHLRYVVDNVDVSESAAVVGLNGSWGSGKTTILNMLLNSQDRLNESSIVIKFNPWMISGAQSLIEHLFNELILVLLLEKKCKKQNYRIAQRLVNFSYIFGHMGKLAPLAEAIIPGSGLAATASGEVFKSAAESGKEIIKQAQDFAKKNSLTEIKKEIYNELKSSNKRIIICIDDLDRIPPSEITSIMQMIKAVIDFPKIVYLLLYEKNIVEFAIEKTLHVNGKSFLEKIICYELTVPIPPTKIQLDMLFSALTRTIPNITDGDRFLIKDSLGKIRFFIKTPRDINRLSIAFNSAISQFKQTNIPIDQILKIEAARQKIPDFVKWLSNFRKIYKDKSLHYNINRDQYNEKIETLYKLTGLEDYQALKHTLYFERLFDASGLGCDPVWSYWLSSYGGEDFVIRDILSSEGYNITQSEYSENYERFINLCNSVCSWGRHELRGTFPEKFIELWGFVAKRHLGNNRYSDTVLNAFREVCLSTGLDNFAEYYLMAAQEIPLHDSICNFMVVKATDFPERVRKEIFEEWRNKLLQDFMEYNFSNDSYRFNNNLSLLLEIYGSPNIFSCDIFKNIMEIACGRTEFSVRDAMFLEIDKLFDTLPSENKNKNAMEVSKKVKDVLSSTNAPSMAAWISSLPA